MNVQRPQLQRLALLFGMIFGMIFGAARCASPRSAAAETRRDSSTRSTDVTVVFVRQVDLERAAFQIINRSDHPVRVDGYGAGRPTYAYQIRSLANPEWRHVDLGWCGTGASGFTLPAGTRDEFEADLPDPSGDPNSVFRVGVGVVEGPVQLDPSTDACDEYSWYVWSPPVGLRKPVPVAPDPASSSGQTPISVEDELRAKYAEPFKVLKSSDRFAIARSDTHVLHFDRRPDGAWRLRLRAALPDDWISESDRGFSTFVDEPRLRRAYVEYLRHTEGHGTPASPVSSASRLPRDAPRRWNIVGEPVAVAGGPSTSPAQIDRLGAFQVDCLGADGRYAFFIVTGISVGSPVDDFCFNVEGFPRLVLFRADDGREWKVHDEVMVPNSGMHTWE